MPCFKFVNCSSVPSTVFVTPVNAVSKSIADFREATAIPPTTPLTIDNLFPILSIFSPYFFSFSPDSSHFFPLVISLSFCNTICLLVSSIAFCISCCLVFAFNISLFVFSIVLCSEFCLLSCVASLSASFLASSEFLPHTFRSFVIFLS